ncbi:MAG: N-acetylmuramoyl-L-alanine amidase [Acidobacteriota bacterium]|nr:N-acetylmuramoyl-L-alanine amidase [Acidobacteriota bacterium]
MRNRRLRALLISLLALLAASSSAQQPAYALISKEGRRALPYRVQGGQDMFALTDLAAAFTLTVREDVAAGGIVVTTRDNKTIVLTPGQPLVSANGRVVSLPSPPLREGRVWLVPIEFVSRALAPALNTRLEVRRPSRVILVGDVRVPQVTVSFEGDAARTRVNIDITPSTPRAVTQDGQRLIVRFDADALDLQAAQSGDGRDIVIAARVSDAPQTLVLDLGAKAGAFQTSVQPRDRGGERLVVEIAALGAEPVPASPVDPAAPAEPPPLPDLSAAGGIRTIVIDPGHGGDDRGARGAGGTLEKDVTLKIAYRLKAALESSLGVRVLLTRDGDRTMRADERASLANNNKADLFISLHANAAASAGPSGAEVFTLAREGYAIEGETSPAPAAALPVFGGGTRAIEILPWNTAQIRWTGDSERLSRLVHAELSGRVPMNARGLDKAPFRVLIGANMPAILVETGFLTNPAQEKVLAGDTLQNDIAQAIASAITRYRDGGDIAPPAPPGGGR